MDRYAGAAVGHVGLCAPELREPTRALKRYLEHTIPLLQRHGVEHLAVVRGRCDECVLGCDHGNRAMHCRP